MMIPLGVDISTWAASLFIDFPTDNIPILNSPGEWQEWGNHLVNCTTFGDNNSPGTADFNDWQAWAQAVYYTVADST